MLRRQRFIRLGPQDMPPALGLSIDQLAAPQADGRIIIWPDPAVLHSLAEANRALRRQRPLRLLDRPAIEWSGAREDQPPRFMSGHQPDFFHPGVWLKGVAAGYLAQAAGGVHSFLLVDSDVPGHIRLEWPEEDGERLAKRFRSVALGEVPFEAIGLQQAEQVLALLDNVRPPGFGATHQAPSPSVCADALLERFASGFEAASSAGYVDRWTGGFSQVSSELGLKPPAFERVSRRFDFDATGDESAAAFAAHLILHAPTFAAAYNRAIADYRRRRGIRGTRHPIPDLETDPDRIELPLWLTRSGEPRRRLFVVSAGPEAIGLSADQAKVGLANRVRLLRQPAKALAEACAGWRLRPRALAQTMYARLALCDLFIHGIGGAKYDQITDGIIRSFFDIEPPAYGCVSATLWLPLPRFDATEEELGRLRQLNRDFRHNPQRYLADHRISPALRARLDERAAAIRESERRRVESPRDRAARRAAFERIRRANARLLTELPTALEDTPGRIAELDRHIRHDRVAKYREWFFALYPADKLRQLAQSLRRALP